MMHCVVYVVNAENPGAALVGEAAEEIFKEIKIRVGKRSKQWNLINSIIILFDWHNFMFLQICFAHIEMTAISGKLWQI